MDTQSYEKNKETVQLVSILLPKRLAAHLLEINAEKFFDLVTILTAPEVLERLDWLLNPIKLKIAFDEFVDIALVDLIAKDSLDEDYMDVISTLRESLNAVIGYTLLTKKESYHENSN